MKVKRWIMKQQQERVLLQNGVQYAIEKDIMQVSMKIGRNYEGEKCKKKNSKEYMTILHKLK